VTITVFMLFFADSGSDRHQATMMGGVAIVITSTLLPRGFLDHPYPPESAAFGLSPGANARILDGRPPYREPHDSVPRARAPGKLGRL
jgi:hypothetical protein